ncbi:hypothetical protein QBC40DRAFT_300369 [Triangularia verruculosa]|uniref:Uncharacterized protein n=1 Tax=Triangularia verruculosa TaxID=2587418 RepID=A0AAN6XBJ0_9PEZI|nr:hypothetical protein QBC40DRAFT_300369 [Triangularia verruculosa]
MSANVFDWDAIEAIELNEEARGRASERVLKSIARNTIQELHNDKDIPMSVLFHDCREMLRRVNHQYLIATRSVIDKDGRSVKGVASNRLVMKRDFFTFMLGWIEKSMEKKGITEDLETLWSNLDLLRVERDWDVVGFDGDWAIVGDAEFA